MEGIPPALAEVHGSLREADEYGRLQLVRQKGLSNLLQGAPGFLFILWAAVPYLVHGPAWLAVYVLLLALLVVASYPRLVLPWVRRRRPDWEATFLEAGVLQKAMEKVFWFQLACVLAYFVVGTIVALAILLPFFSNPSGSLPPDHVLLWTCVVLHAAAMVLLAWRSRRTRDGLVAGMYWAGTALAPLGLLHPSHQLPDLFQSLLFVACVALPPLLAGAFRLLAPRRWLVE